MFTISPNMKTELLEPRTSGPGQTHGAGDAMLDEASLAALRVSEICYRRLFEAARDGVLLLDL